MFQNLEPNQNYSVSVTMRNGVGEGPPAIIYISTTREPTGTLRRVIYIYLSIKKNADTIHKSVFQSSINFIISKNKISSATNFQTL